jgi:hypothetical protein
MMEEIPLSLWECLSEADLATVRFWWSGLDSAARQTVVDAVDPRWDDCSFGFFAEGNPKFLPQIETRPFLPCGNTLLREEWEEDFREYLTEHPDTQTASLFQEIRIWCMPYIGRHWELTIRVDWEQIRCEQWLLPPSERGKK